MNYKDPLKMIDPITGMEMTNQPPVPANQQGTAKDLFSQTAQNTAGQIYGDLNARQTSLGDNAPMFMSDKYEGLKAESNK